jgi:ABC-type Fe3+/spermidine/putrescine transport system ATPase subunit
MLKIKGLIKKFDNLLAVNGVSLNCKKGETLAVLGPSGCGKTTLLRLIAGFEKPDEGEILINGELVSQPNKVVAPNQRHLNMIFQDLALWPHMTVERNIEFSLNSKIMDKFERKNRVKEILKKVYLNGYEKRYPGKLSSGEQQRVALARSLVVEPKLLLMDEPLSSLDSILKRQLLKLTISLKDQLGLTMVYVTHNQEEAISIADRIAIMNYGQIEQIGTLQEMRCNPASKLVEDFLNIQTNTRSSG